MSAPLTISQSLTSGLAQSPLVQAANLQAQQQAALSLTAYDVPHLTIDYQYGQIQGPLTDHTLNILQHSALPSLYAAQHQVLQTTAEGASLRAQRRELARDSRYRPGYKHQPRHRRHHKAERDAAVVAAQEQVVMVLLVALREAVAIVMPGARTVVLHHKLAELSPLPAAGW